MTTLSRIYRIEGEQVYLQMHTAQEACWAAPQRFVFFIAGTQSGKTTFGPWWLYREIQDRGPGDYLAVTATYDLFKLKMLPALQEVFENTLARGRYWAGERVIEIADPQGRFLARRASDPMWGRIILRSAESEGGLEAATAQAAWLDEVGQDNFKLAAWEAVLRRLSLAQGRVLGTTTPYNLGWLKTEVFDRWRAGNPEFFVVQAESVVNPSFPRAEFERARSTLPAWKFQMFYRGEFARPAGLIYEDFDEEMHVVEPFVPPLEWPRYVGLDFGPLHTSTVWLAEDVRRAALYVYRDTLEGSMTTGEHAEHALQRAEHERVLRWVGGAAAEKQYRWDWQAAGVPVEAPEVGDVEAGIDRVTAWLKQKRLFVFRSCRGLREEFATYSRKLDSSGQLTEAIRDKEKFHRLDALRYILSVFPIQGETVQLVDHPWF